MSAPAMSTDSSLVGVALFPSFQHIFYHLTFPGFPFFVNVCAVLFSGPAAAKQAVQRAREQIHTYRGQSHSITPCAPIPDGPPPPYSPTNHMHDNAPYNPHYLPHSPPEAQMHDSSNPFHTSLQFSFGSYRSLPEVSEEHGPQNRTSFSPSTNPFDGEVDNR